MVPSLLLCGSSIIILQQKWITALLNEDNTRNINLRSINYVITVFLVLIPVSLVLLYKNTFVITHKGKFSVGFIIIGIICIILAVALDKQI